MKGQALIQRALFMVAFLLLPSLVSADWVKHSSGYWLKQNGATNDGWYYTRGQVRDSYGRCTWQYFRHHQYVPPATAPSYAHTDTVPQAVLAIAKQEREYEFLRQSLRDLGYVKGGYPGYGGAPGYQNAPAYGHPAGTPANQYGHGSTYYGYSSYSTHQPTPVDVMVLQDRAARGRDQAGRQFAEAQAQVTAMSGQLANDQLTAAKAEIIRDLGNALVDKIAALQSPEVRAETVFHTEASASASAGQAEADDGDDGRTGSSEASSNPSTVQYEKQLAASIDARCLSCHSGDAPKGGFDISQAFEFDRATWLKVAERVTTSDETLRMPRGADGPGHALPENEQLLYLQAYAKAK